MSRKLKQSGSSAAPDLFISSAKEKDVVQQLQAHVKSVIKASYPDVEALIQAIEATGLPVISKVPALQCKFSLMLIGEQPGFIMSSANKYEDFIKALVKHVPEKAYMDYSEGVLVTLKDGLHYAFLTYHFYHWMAYKHGLEGYDPVGRKLFETFNRKYHGQLHPKFLEKLNYQEAGLLKMAIRRDREALQFVRHILHEVFIPANNGKLLDKGEAQA
jgi:hypothetical protein